MLRALTETTGVLTSGRRLFDITSGWGDNHPMGVPVVVVTHHPPAHALDKWPKTTLIDGVEAVVDRARKMAGNKNVVISSANIIQQALNLGLVDEICISLAPVELGEGIPLQACLRGIKSLRIPSSFKGSARRLHL